MCQQTGVFSQAGLVVFDVVPGRQMFPVCKNTAAFRKGHKVLLWQETNSSDGEKRVRLV